jgi:DNA repair ATPase RecN
VLVNAAERLANVIQTADLGDVREFLELTDKVVTNLKVIQDYEDGTDLDEIYDKTARIVANLQTINEDGNNLEELLEKTNCIDNNLQAIDADENNLEELLEETNNIVANVQTIKAHA